MNSEREFDNPRQACSVESAARINPHAQVYLIFTSQNQVNLQNSKLVQVLSTYPNINFRYMVPIQFSRRTFLRQFFQSKILANSSFHVENRADVLRVLLMGRYGGQYLDLDIISLVPLDQIKYKNFGCPQIRDKINNAVMHFEVESGRRILMEYGRRLTRNFHPTYWAANGPRMYTRAIKTFCNKTIFEEDSITKCANFTSLPTTKCHPIPHQEFSKFYEEDYRDEVMQSIKGNGSYFVHIWNKMQEFGHKSYKLSVDSKSAYVELAKIHCPKVFETLDDYF